MIHRFQEEEKKDDAFHTQPMAVTCGRRVAHTHITIQRYCFFLNLIVLLIHLTFHPMIAKWATVGSTSNLLTILLPRNSCCSTSYILVHKELHNYINNDKLMFISIKKEIDKNLTFKQFLKMVQLFKEIKVFETPLFEWRSLFFKEAEKIYSH